jgi:hypothetical protein
MVRSTRPGVLHVLTYTKTPDSNVAEIVVDGPLLRFAALTLEDR